MLADIIGVPRPIDVPEEKRSPTINKISISCPGTPSAWRPRTASQALLILKKGTFFT